MVSTGKILIRILVYLIFVNPFIQYVRPKHCCLKRLDFCFQDNQIAYSIDSKSEVLCQDYTHFCRPLLRPRGGFVRDRGLHKYSLREP